MSCGFYVTTMSFASMGASERERESKALHGSNIKGFKSCYVSSTCLILVALQPAEAEQEMLILVQVGKLNISRKGS